VEIIFETHALTLDNERGIATGWNGGELSSEGRRLATELGERHRPNPPSAVISFTSMRL
jgi:2,3-bisphosphoglycerate-dependent phosphoglycerate mutase